MTMKPRTAIYALLATILLAGCGHKTATSILPPECALEPGDLVFRRGGGMMSRAVVYADIDGNYSHVGIAVDSAGCIMIVHAVPGEPDYEGDPDRVKMETPDKFYCSQYALTGEVKRLKDDPETARAAARYALEVYERGTLFDHRYDDNDTTKMYCCELVEFAYTKAGCPLAGEKRHSFKVPGICIEACILPSDICNSELLTTITTF